MPRAHGERADARAIERLFEASLADFIRVRRELVAQARASGDPASARRVAAVAKPSRTAWALNQVARSHAKLLATMLDARRDAEKAQRAGATTMRALADAYRAKTNDVVRAARDALASAGMTATAAQLRELSELLHAASATEGDLRERLLAGRLVRATVDDEDDDLSDALEIGARATKARVSSSDVDADHRHAKASEENARKAAEAKARKAAEARAREEAANAARERAHAKEVARATRGLDALVHAAAKAREAADAADAKVEEARASLKALEALRRGS